GVELATIDTHRAAEATADVESRLDNGVAGEAWRHRFEIGDFPGRAAAGHTVTSSLGQGRRSSILCGAERSRVPGYAALRRRFFADRVIRPTRRKSGCCRRLWPLAGAPRQRALSRSISCNTGLSIGISTQQVLPLPGADTSAHRDFRADRRGGAVAAQCQD